MFGSGEICLAIIYSLNMEGLTVANRMAIWYVMDELGSGILHSNTPNGQAVSFIPVTEQMTYSLLFPFEDDQLYRDFVAGVPGDYMERDALLLPWRRFW